MASSMYASKEDSTRQRPRYFKSLTDNPDMNACVVPPGRRLPGVRPRRPKPRWSIVERKRSVNRRGSPAHSLASGGQSAMSQGNKRTRLGSFTRANWKRPSDARFLGSRSRRMATSSYHRVLGKRTSPTTNLRISPGRRRQWCPSRARTAKLMPAILSVDATLDNPITNDMRKNA